jgi:drug/metabolite transporter (DMT)-like permease
MNQAAGALLARPGALQSLWMLAASFGFACMGVCVKFAAERYAVAEIVFWRSVVAVALSALFMRTRGLGFATGQWRWQLARGTIGFLALLFFFSAIALLPLATAVTLNYTSALFFCAFLAAAGATRLNGEFAAVLMVGFAGIVLLLKPVLSEADWLGGLYGLASGACAGMAYFSVRLLGRRGEHEIRTVFYFSAVSVVAAGAWVAVSGLSPIDGEGALLLAGVGLFATLAQLAMTRSYRRGKTVLSASLSYSAVPFACLFGFALWGETLDAAALLGIALIVAGGVAATYVARSSPAERD